MVLLWVVLVLAIANAVRYLDRKRGESFRPRPPPPPTAQQVLAEQFSGYGRSTARTSTASVLIRCAAEAFGHRGGRSRRG